MNANMKQVTRFFGTWAADKETEWLNRMARQGWYLHDLQFLTYRFRLAESSNTVYQLDYQVVAKENWQDYLELFAEAGWTYVTSITNWHYFRADGDRAEIQPLHTDNASKIAMLKRLLTTLLATGWMPIFIAMMVFSQFDERYESGSFSLFVTGLGIVLILLECLLIYSFLRIMRMIGKLQKSPKE